MATYEAKSEVTGAVWKITTAVGDRIEPGDPIMIIESMKMEIPVIAEHPGTVTGVWVTPGDVVQEGDVLLALSVAH